MRANRNPPRPARSRRARSFAIATLLAGLSVAGCGGSSGNPPGSAGSAASTASSHTLGATTGAPSGLAFADCMRSNGVPSFPDPLPGKGLLFHANPGVISSPAFKAAQAKCHRLLPGGPPGPGSHTHPSAKTLTKLVKIAACMRRHGVSQFPDPRTSVPSNPAGITEITDFDGAILLFPSTMNLQAPAYRQDLAACGAPPLGLPH